MSSGRCFFAHQVYQLPVRAGDALLGFILNKFRSYSWSRVTPNTYRRPLTTEWNVNRVQRLHYLVCSINRDIVDKRASVDFLYRIDFQPLYIPERRRDMPWEAAFPMLRWWSVFPQCLGAKAYGEVRNRIQNLNCLAPLRIIHN